MSTIGASISDAEQSLRNQSAGRIKILIQPRAAKSQAWASQAGMLLSALQQQQARCQALLEKINGAS